MKTFDVYKEDEKFIQNVSGESFKNTVIWKREMGVVMLECKGGGNDKAVLVTGRGGQQDCETSRLPHSLDSRLRCQPYPQEDSWYSFLLEAESTPGPYCGCKD
jgi:hypothetical protein